MERWIYIAMVLVVFNFSCKDQEQDKKGTQSNEKGTGASEAEITNSKKNDDGLSDLNLEDMFKGDVDIEGAAMVFSQMMGTVSIEKKRLIQTDIDSLKSLLEQHPNLSQAIAIEENTVDVDFSKLLEAMSEMEPQDLNTLNGILPKITSSAAAGSGRPDHPFAGTFFEQDLKEISSGSIQKRVENKRLYQNLRDASPEEAKQLLADHYGIDLEEVELLNSIEKQSGILNEKQAQNLTDPVYSNAVEMALDDPKTSSNFKALINENKEMQKRSADKFLKKSSSAREAFYKLNPGWYSETSDEIGNTYADTRNKQIYLPLGKRSFADAVVDFDPGNGGQYPEGALHEPDLTVELARLNQAKPEMCSIGLKGVLTLQFLDNAITDVNGPDLYVFEAGAIEPTVLELSKDGSNWLEVGKIEGGTAMVDIHDFVRPGETFTYVRLTDLETRSGVPGADVDAVAAIGGALRLNLDSSVLFEFGKYDLRPEAETLLMELIPQIEGMGKGTIVVEGHTDNVGSAQANKQLSEQRANSVSILLKSLMSASADHFSWEIRGLGDTQPIAPNDNDENRQKNRRVELLVLPK
ncbi:MAG: OmpA family protein [Flavobacteriaceae bacterium]|uniref:OmpA family protein n=1 Tax=Flagellimonas sp. SN16 TaxID=3415142 RepID=UPI003C450A6A|nr:OmpA family protein [Flavobacteriaceae bacterium]